MIKFSKFATLLVALLFAVTSCDTTKNVYTDGQNPDGGFEGEATRPDKTGDGDGGWVSVGPGGGGDVVIDDNELGPEIPATEHGFGPVYFKFNSAKVEAAEDNKLNALASYLRDNGSFILVLNGHTDERGSEEYNTALSERRALAVKDYIVSIDASLANRINTNGYGETQLVDPAQHADAHAVNRRAEIQIFSGK